MIFGVAKEATTVSAGDNEACSDGRYRKDECGGRERIRAECKDFSKMESLCYGHRSWEELLCL